jgi:hypothetical protein
MKPEYANSLPDGWDRFSRFFFALGDTTRHLKILRNAELLVCEKRGKEVYYRVNHDHCAEVMRVVREFIVTRAPSPALTISALS